ncbi:MAG: phosphopyruvate hydratase, partial [Patescibacteria group bacterium]|nr:phosphopyruvate hydratase [Patescibacteria group bacterium]
MAKIKQITAREILNGKGNPTVEATVVLSDDTTASASSPSGTSMGTFEAAYLRDNDPGRFAGLGVLNAVSNIQNVIGPKLVGFDASKQQEIDRTMIDLDGTQNKSRLGANATLTVSMAIAKAAAKSSVLPLFAYLKEFIKKEATPLKIPTPIFSMLNGGRYAGNNLDFESFFIIPASSKTYSEALQIGFSVYN